MVPSSACGLTLAGCQPSGLRLRVSEQRRDDTLREKYLEPDVRQGFQSSWGREPHPMIVISVDPQ